MTTKTQKSQTVEKPLHFANSQIKFKIPWRSANPRKEKSPI
jgi:hypothetical protein